MSLSPRLIAIQGIGFTPIQIAVQGLLDYIAGGGETTRRPRANAAVKLTKIQEGRAWLRHSKAQTTAKALRATGYAAPVITVSAPSHAVLLPCRASTRARPARGVASGTTILRGSPKTTCYAAVVAHSAGARVELLSSAVTSAGRPLGSAGAGVGRLLTAQSATACERIRARGVRNLSNYELAAVAVFIDRRR